MFIKVTIIRTEIDESKKEKEVEILTLQNLNEVKQFQKDPETGIISMMYKSYNEDGEEYDIIKEKGIEIIERLREVKLYAPKKEENVTTNN